MFNKSVELVHESAITILWNEQVKTDRTILNNKQDVTIHDNEKETSTRILRDDADSGDRNVIKKEADTILK